MPEHFINKLVLDIIQHEIQSHNTQYVPIDRVYKTASQHGVPRDTTEESITQLTSQCKINHPQPSRITLPHTVN